MIVAIATHPESLNVERFSHDFPIVMHDIENGQITRSTQLTSAGGCCRALAHRLHGADVLICTGVGHGAARHLAEEGVPVALVKEGMRAAEALAAWATDRLVTTSAEPSDCHEGSSEGCHHHAHEHSHDDSKRT